MGISLCNQRKWERETSFLESFSNNHLFIIIVSNVHCIYPSIFVYFLQEEAASPRECVEEMATGIQAIADVELDRGLDQFLFLLHYFYVLTY